ncbi:MAG TPA: nucleotidyl transferase AbiEii/AbiGii toxin family protein, partial [Thermoanaerobaculia bacterium]|nr:nucleotidyl transferase AbiEii/AbiGii toxin family protein [Thermoanaerobaculia bacterium]
MFKRQAHRNVLTLLRALDADLLSRCGFLFGGGTRIVLQLDEYRESQDVDFLCSDAAGYSDLRYQASTQGYKALFQNMDGLDFPRE